MKTHELKIDSSVFWALAAGAKTWEIRKNDRDFQVGDTVILLETRYTGVDMLHSSKPLIYTGNKITATITYILHGPIYGLEEGWVIMSVKEVLDAS